MTLFCDDFLFLALSDILPWYCVLLILVLVLASFYESILTCEYQIFLLPLSGIHFCFVCFIFFVLSVGRAVRCMSWSSSVPLLFLYVIILIYFKIDISGYWCLWLYHMISWRFYPYLFSGKLPFQNKGRAASHNPGHMHMLHEC